MIFCTSKCLSINLIWGHDVAQGNLNSCNLKVNDLNTNSASIKLRKIKT